MGKPLGVDKMLYPNEHIKRTRQNNTGFFYLGYHGRVLLCRTLLLVSVVSVGEISFLLLITDFCK